MLRLAIILTTALLLLAPVPQTPALSISLAWDVALPQAAQVAPEGYVLTRNGFEVLRTTYTHVIDVLPRPGTYVYTVEAFVGAAVSAPSNAVSVTAQTLTCAYTQVSGGFTIACVDATAIPPAGPYPRLAVGHMIVQAVDSQETVGEDGRAINALDGQPHTIWHTQWVASSPPLPHALTLDLGAVLWVDGLSYLPRQSGGSNGTLTRYRLDTSQDLITWTALPSGSWPNDPTEKTVRFAAVKARYVRLVALLSNGTPYASAAEVGVYAVEMTP